MRETQSWRRGHKLLPQELCQAIPMLYSQEKVKDPMVVAHYFSPFSGWDWYVLEGAAVKYGLGGEEETFPLSKLPLDVAQDVIFFGLVKGFEEELGYFTLTELEAATVGIRGAGIPAVERDLYWTLVPLSQVKSGSY